MSFADLKRNSKSNFDKLSEELTKAGGAAASKSDDERFWKPKTDAAGNGFAIIRFLPAPAGEDLPFVKVWSHGFQGPGGWYIENSLTTLGEDDPCGKMNSDLWNSTTDDKSPARNQARKQKRKTSYYSNIYVVKDSANPENEGKVFLFRYGVQIYKILNAAMHPEFEDETPINPFDLWTGANFKVKIRTGEYGPNYEKSEFDSPAALDDDDSKLEEIYNQTHSLQAFLDRKNFKTYEELEKKLFRVLKIDQTSNAGPEKAAPAQEETPAPTPSPTQEPEAVTPDLDDDDDSLDDYFKSIVDDD